MNIREVCNFFESINNENEEYKLHNDFLTKENNLLLDTLKSLSNHLLAIDEDLVYMSNGELLINLLKIKGAIKETLGDYEDLEKEFLGDLIMMEYEQIH